MDKYANGYITIPFNASDFNVFDESSTYLDGNKLMPASKMAQLCIETANKPKKLFESRWGLFADLIVDVSGLSANPKQIVLLFIANNNVELIVKKEIYLSYIPSEEDESIYEWAYTDAGGERSNYANVFIFQGTGVQ